jgi:hypothetical protein
MLRTHRCEVTYVCVFHPAICWRDTCNFSSCNFGITQCLEFRSNFDWLKSTPLSELLAHDISYKDPRSIAFNWNSFCLLKEIYEKIHSHSCINQSRKLRLPTLGIRRADHVTPLYPQKLALNFVDKWRSISRYISLAD